MADGSSRSSWTNEEVAATVAAYLDMFERELRGEQYSKAEHNRALRKVLRGRSKQAIEYKWGNVSAALRDLGCFFIEGYKPYPNYQLQLRAEAERQLATRAGLSDLISQVASSASEVPSVTEILKRLVTAPGPEDLPRRAQRVSEPTPRAEVGRDYVGIESANRNLGRAGEEFVMAFERARLIAARKPRLADRVEHVAATRGDGLGYDVLSFETSGRERLIEVKTTKFGIHTPFLITRNEVRVSDACSDHYALYRVFSFRKNPRLFALAGSVLKHVRLDPVLFEARAGA